MRQLLQALALGALFTASGAHSADVYPIRPITLIVQFPPGGTTDIVARLMAVGMARELGQPVIVENRAGASGIIGSDYAAKAPGDGYIIGMATVTTHAINPFVRKLPFDVHKDLTPVINLAAVPNVMTINPTVPANSIKELVSVLKVNPGKYAYATSGSGAEGHVAMEAFNKISKTQALHVPYKGSAPALQDTIGGQTQIMIGNLPSLLPFIQAGKLRALAVTAPKRLSVLPNVPTYAEEGFPEMNRASWFGIVTSAKTPKAIIDKLNAAANKVLEEPSTRAALEKVGATPIGGTPAEFGEVLKAEMDVQREVVRKANIQAD